MLCMQGSPLFGSAILLIRNPLDAILAEWNRQATNSHIGYANTTTFSKYYNVVLTLWFISHSSRQ